MSTTHEDKSNEKPRQRSRKAGQRGQKAARQRDGDQIDAVIASDQVTSSDAAVRAEPQSLIGEAELLNAVATEGVAAESAAPAVAAASTNEAVPVNMQTIANAYRDYTRKSLQVNRSFVERLMDVRSVDKAVEVQTDYARQAYANFVTESLNICALYRELAAQAFRPGRRHA